MESNITTIMQQKKQFHASHWKHCYQAMKINSNMQAWPVLCVLFCVFFFVIKMVTVQSRPVHNGSLITEHTTFITDNLHNESVLNECGVLWTGLSWRWSVMNRSVLNGHRTK